jgi:hypothetical protein
MVHVGILILWLVVISAAVAAMALVEYAFDRGRRFSMRRLMLFTTLVAIVLGLVGWASRLG